VSQSQWIAVSIFVGFIVFITIRGELPLYRQAIFSGASDTSAPPVSTATAASHPV
jgi:hypothetical protein